MQAGQDSDGWVVGLEGMCTLHAVIMLCNVFVTVLPDMAATRMIRPPARYVCTLVRLNFV